MSKEVQPGIDLVPVETPEAWAKISGEEATGDMLFVVEVYAEWCGPTLAANTTFRNIKDNLISEGKKIKCFKICAEVVEDLEKFRVNACPTFLLFVGGDQVAMVQGVSMPALEKLISEHMPEGFLEAEEETEAAAAEDED